MPIIALLLSYCPDIKILFSHGNDYGVSHEVGHGVGSGVSNEVSIGVGHEEGHGVRHGVHLGFLRELVSTCHEVSRIAQLK